jgi:hypothetical protein
MPQTQFVGLAHDRPGILAGLVTFRGHGGHLFLAKSGSSDGSQNPRIWQGNHGQSGDYREHRASYEVRARTVTPRAWESAKGTQMT